MKTRWSRVSVAGCCVLMAALLISLKRRHLDEMQHRNSTAHLLNRYKELVRERNTLLKEKYQEQDRQQQRYFKDTWDLRIALKNCSEVSVSCSEKSQTQDEYIVKLQRQLESIYKVLDGTNNVLAEALSALQLVEARVELLRRAGVQIPDETSEELQRDVVGAVEQLGEVDGWGSENEPDGEQERDDGWMIYPAGAKKLPDVIEADRFPATAEGTDLKQRRLNKEPAGNGQQPEKVRKQTQDAGGQGWRRSHEQDVLQL